MNNMLKKSSLCGLIFMVSLFIYGGNVESKLTKINIEWHSGEIQGGFDIINGNIEKIAIAKGTGRIEGNEFQFLDSGTVRLTLEISNPQMQYGPGSTLVSIKTMKNPFSFFLRDIRENSPIYMPEYEVVVLAEKDDRSYTEVEKDILLLKTMTKIQRIEKESETSFSSVENKVRDMSVPIWLGMSRDMRIFEVSEELEDTGQEAKIIRPKYSSSSVNIPEFGEEPLAYIYALGRGKGVENNITRYLEEGSLPIYHSKLKDDDITYNTTSFVSFEKMALTQSTNKGTHYVISDKHSSGRSFKSEHLQLLEKKMKDAYNFDDNVILYSRTEIRNNGNVPRYAWIKVPRPGTRWTHKRIHDYDIETGFSLYKNKVFCISKLNGVPLTNEELSILLLPGETIEFDFYLPHSPVAPMNAKLISEQSFDKRLKEAKDYWKDKLMMCGNINIPEKRINEMVKAGLLHLDLITFGEEPDGILAANVGVYSPIGTESSPIIQFFLSMGWNDIARRAIDYFLDTQLESGLIQNYGDYMAETGAALYTMGEYFRYTNNKDWAIENKEKIIRSCNYLIDWRNRNKKSGLKGKGYGMIDGQVADPVDPYHQFMLNGYGYLGVKRVSEMLRKIDTTEAERLKNEADGWKSDIKESLFTSMANSPVVPLGDGTWSPTVPPWPEKRGARALYLEKEIFWSHGTFTGSDAMLGPLYLVFCEVLEPEEKISKMILKYNSELFYQGNSAFSQPYYSRHNWLQAKLGMVKPFLNTYYHTMAAHADRQTYTFWEHMYRVSPHKTHEEAWFLMETRWMLYMEEGNTLKLLNTIPRKWMEDGKTIELNGVQSYFGPLNVKVDSHINKGFIEAIVECNSNRKPQEVIVRMPHPNYKKAVKVTGGEYNPDTEMVTIGSFNGKAYIKVEY